MYFANIPPFIRNYYREYTWRLHAAGKVIYLTFDDGPTPAVTEWVCRCLEEYEAKATFFLVGEHVKKYPEIVHQLIDTGHSIGNHTHSHRNGWKTELKPYLKDFLKGQRAISEYTGYETRLFRPPYGRITRVQARHIMRTHQIIMMDVISGDFDPKLKSKASFKRIVKSARDGSIILFHDSKKTESRLKGVLPRVLEHFSEKGYRFKAIPNEIRRSL